MLYRIDCLGYWSLSSSKFSSHKSVDGSIPPPLSKNYVLIWSLGWSSLLEMIVIVDLESKLHIILSSH